MQISSLHWIVNPPDNMFISTWHLDIYQFLRYSTGNIFVIWDNFLFFVNGLLIFEYGYS